MLRLIYSSRFYDDVAGLKDSIEMEHVAKVIGIQGIGRNNLCYWNLNKFRKLYQ